MKFHNNSESRLYFLMSFINVLSCTVPVFFVLWD